MANRSSTSSSKRCIKKHGFPWALALALVLVLCFELLVHQIDPAKLITHERGIQSRFAARHTLDLYGAANVSFIGSSRTLVGITCPELRETVNAALQQDVSVANYASDGAKLQELLPLLRYLLRSNPRPKVIVLPVWATQFQDSELANERSAVFWNLEDWWRTRKEIGSQVDEYLPIVIRNMIGEHFLTLRHRKRPMHYLKELKSGGPVQVARKGEHVQLVHLDDPDKVHVVTPEVIEGIETNPFFLEHAATHNQKQLDMVIEMNRLAQDAGVQFAVVEAPNHSAVLKHYPHEGLEDTLKTIIRKLEAKGVAFVTLDELDTQFKDDEFRDNVHLNFKGAKHWSDAIAKKIVVPRLAGAQSQPAH